MNKAKQEIEVLPRGHLCCSRSNGVEQYLVDGKYASKKRMDWIKGIAQREYYEELIPALENVLKKLYSVEKIFNNQVIHNCYQESCNARKKLITPIFSPLEEQIQKFMEEQYAPGEFKQDDRTEFFTGKGERVRSKSELLIAEQLGKYRVPYRYEKPINLTDRKRVIVCRPDFTVMNRNTGKIYLYEHLGKMDDLAYVQWNMQKLDLYEKNGYLIGKNLIITRETLASPMSIGKVDSYIKEFFL